MYHPRKTIPHSPRQRHLSLEHLSFLWVRFSKINDHKLSKYQLHLLYEKIWCHKLYCTSPTTRLASYGWFKGWPIIIHLLIISCHIGELWVKLFTNLLHQYFSFSFLCFFFLPHTGGICSPPFHLSFFPFSNVNGNKRAII